MTTVDQLLFRLEADSRQLRSELKKAGHDVDQFSDRGKKRLSSFEQGLKTAGRAAVALGVVLAGREFIQAADTYQLLSSRLRLVTSSTEELTRVTNALFISSQNTRQSFEQTANLYARIGRSAKALGKTQDELLQVTENIQKAIVVSGASGAEASAGLIQFSQGLASGALRGDELRSVLEQLPRLALALADGMGTTIAQLREMGAEGALAGDKVIDALLSQTGVLENEFRQIPKTVAGSMQQIQNELLRVTGEVSTATDSTSSLNDALDELREIVASESFKTGLTEIAGGIAGLASAAASAIGILGDLTSTLGESGAFSGPSLFEMAKIYGALLDGTRGNGPTLDTTDFDEFQKALEGLGFELKAVEVAAESAGVEIDNGAKAAEKARKAHEKLVASLEQEIENNGELAVALRVSEKEYEIVARKLEILGKGFIGTDEEARAFAETLHEQEEILQGIQDEYDRTAEAAADAAEETARVWERAGDSIADALSDALFEGEDLFDSLLSAGRRAAAEFATLQFRAVFTGGSAGGGASGSGSGLSVPGIGGGQIGGGGSTGFGGFGGLGDLGSLFSGGGLGFNAGAGNFGVDIAQFIGGGAETQALLGNAAGRLGSFGGMAGAFGGNLLANALLGDRGIGASIGGSIGAIAGSFIPIPVVGPLIGSAIGNAIGGLFGNQTPSVGQVIGGGFIGSGQLDGVGVDNDGDLGAAQQFGEDMQTVLERILGASGGDIASRLVIEKTQNSGILSNIPGVGRHSYTGSDLVGAVQFGLKNNISGATDQNVVKALQNSKATGSDFETLFEDIGLAEFITSLQSANDNISPLQQAIDGVTEAYAKQIDQAKSLGLSTSELAAQRDKENQALRDAVAAQAKAFDDNIDLRRMALSGDNRGVLSATLDAASAAQLAQAQSLVDAQVITQNAFDELSSLLDDEVLKSLADFDKAIAAQAATIAEQSRVFNDNLTIRERTVAGDDRGALVATLESSRLSQLAQAQSLLDAGVISADALTRLNNVLNDEILKSLSDFDDSLVDVVDSSAALAAQQKLSISQASSEKSILENLFGAAGNISSFSTAFRLSEQSSLNPNQRIDLAQSEFDTLLSSVQGGNLGAVGALTSSAGTLLGLKREQFASTSQFTDAEAAVLSQLQSVQASILSDENIATKISDAFALLDENEETRNERLIAALKDEIGALRQDINLLRIAT